MSNTKVISYPCQFSRVTQTAREGQSCPNSSKSSKMCPNQCKTNIFFLFIFIIFGQIQELSPSRFDRLTIFLAKTLCFRVGRADLPFPGQDRVKSFGEKKGLALSFTWSYEAQCMENQTGQAPLKTDPPPTSFTTLSKRKNPPIQQNCRNS